MKALEGGAHTEASQRMKRDTEYEAVAFHITVINNSITYRLQQDTL